MIMYDVEAVIPYCYPSGEVGSDWEDVFNVPQLETEQAELQKARQMAIVARGFYTQVRIIKIQPGGLRSVVS